jgi:hypothetical protein
MALSAAAIACAFALPASGQPKTAPLKLSVAQRQVVWENIWQGQLGAIPIGFEASLGTVVPPAIKLQSMPQPLVDQVPALKPFEFVRARNQILIVEPTGRKVVGVLNR